MNPVRWGWQNVNHKMKAYSFCKMKMKIHYSGFILQNETENVKMKVGSFQNENEMSRSARGPQNDFYEMSLDSFWQWK